MQNDIGFWEVFTEKYKVWMFIAIIVLGLLTTVFTAWQYYTGVKSEYESDKKDHDRQKIEDDREELQAKFRNELKKKSDIIIEKGLQLDKANSALQDMMSRQINYFTDSNSFFYFFPKLTLDNKGSGQIELYLNTDHVKNPISKIKHKLIFQGDKTILPLDDFELDNGGFEINPEIDRAEMPMLVRTISVLNAKESFCFEFKVYTKNVDLTEYIDFYSVSDQWYYQISVYGSNGPNSSYFLYGYNSQKEK